MFSNILVQLRIIGQNESSEGRSEIESAKKNVKDWSLENGNSLLEVRLEKSDH